MPCIRRRYNYGIIYLRPEPIRSKSLAGQTLDVVTRGNDFKRVAFHGFIDIGKVPACTPRVKLINISGFNASASEMGDWVDYGMNSVMLGAYFNAGVWLVLDHGLPVAWCNAVRILPK